MSAVALFSHIEQQLNALRAKALQELEQKVRKVSGNTCLPHDLASLCLPSCSHTAVHPVS